jgi:hypothetical protein
LEAENPQDILNMFESEYLSPVENAAELLHERSEVKEKYVENLIMLLLFFKTWSE